MCTPEKVNTCFAKAALHARVTSGGNVCGNKPELRARCPARLAIRPVGSAPYRPIDKPRRLGGKEGQLGRVGAADVIGFVRAQAASRVSRIS